MPVPVIVTIGVCTCGRPELADTLRSLTAQELPENTRLMILVADNSSPPSAGPIIDAIMRSSDVAISHLIAPPYNISTARNTILTATKSRWLAFIDDDETAPKDWLAELLKRAEKGKADAVFGPVTAEYDQNTPVWMVEGDFHSTDVTFVGQEIVTGYSCNVLMDLNSPHYQGLQFAPELGSTGGEDTLFYSQLHAKGGRLDYAPGARLSEPVPKNRQTFKWLFQRRFRSGQTHGTLLVAKYPNKRLLYLVPTFCKMAFSFLAAAITFPLSVSSKRWMLRGGLHLGAFSRLLGVRELKLYVQP